MATTLETKLRNAAAADAALVTLLGNSPFRWFDTRLPQGSVLPAVVALLVDDTPTYTLTARLPNGLSRMQFTVWDTDAERSRQVAAAVSAFLDGFNGIGISNLSRYPNRVVLTRSGLFAPTEPPIWWRTLDAMIFSNSTL